MSDVAGNTGGGVGGECSRFMENTGGEEEVNDSTRKCSWEISICFGG